MSQLAELIRVAIGHRLSTVRVALPARVELYDVGTQTVNVKPLLKDHLVAQDGELVESLPVVPGVPVAFPRGGGFAITWPLQPGDTGQLVFCDWPLDQWLQLGGEVDPLDLRNHSLGGGVFYPGLHDGTNPLVAHATDLVLKREAGGEIHITAAGEVHLGGELPAEYVALATKVSTELGKLATAINALKTAFNAWTPIPNDGGAALKTAVGTWPTTAVSLSPVAATKVRAL